MRVMLFDFSLSRITRTIRFQNGFTLAETLVSLAILGTVAVVFLGGLVTMSKASSINDKHTTALSLAQNQLEYVKNSPYALEYTQNPLPNTTKYTNYSISIIAEPLNNPDNGIQKITVIVEHSGKQLIQLENYKTDR